VYLRGVEFFKSCYYTLCTLYFMTKIEAETNKLNNILKFEVQCFYYIDSWNFKYYMSYLGTNFSIKRYWFFYERYCFSSFNGPREALNAAPTFFTFACLKKGFLIYLFHVFPRSLCLGRICNQHCRDTDYMNSSSLWSDRSRFFRDLYQIIMKFKSIILLW